MEPNEFEEQLTELETRVDRLRALYENWFRGYEKTEPRVARKDVERRVYGMRKELPRNTALRFRYHQLYQRYTTLAQYWARTARQIEEGTYRLQLQRHRRKKELRAGDQAEAAGAGEAQDGDKKKDRPQSYELNLDESLSVGDLLDDLEMDELARAVDSPGPHLPSEPPPARATFAKPKRKPSTRPPPRPAVPMMRETSSSRPPERVSKREAFFDDEHDQPTGLHLSLDEDLPRAKVPATPPRSTAGSVAAKLPTGPANGGSLPRRTFADGLPAASSPGVPRQTLGDAPPAAPPPPAARPAPSAPRTSVAGVPPPVPGMPRTTVPGGQPSAPPAAAKAPTSPFAPPAANKPAPTAPAGTPAARPVPPPPPPREPPRPPTRPNPVPAQSGNTIVGRPPTASPIAGAAPSGPNLPDQHMRRIYAEYAEARRKNNEGEVRYEAVVNSIQKMMPDLQKKHAGKQIDFEVVVKDGRVGLKPKTNDK